MAASAHSKQGRRHGRSAATVPAGDPAEALLEHGKRLLLAAPELAMVFGERAAALAEAAGSDQLWVYAEGLSVSARVRLGHRANMVHRAVVVLRTAEADGHADLAARMRIELALCARGVGVPLTGLAALRPVLTAEQAPAMSRIAALLQFVGCMASLGRRGMLDRALEEADALATSAPSIAEDDRPALRALVRARAAAHLRRHGDIAASIDSAERGLALLDAADNPVADGMQLRVRLSLELVCALLDRGSPEEAEVIAKPLLAVPARAAAIAPMAWLRLAVATRIYLPAGSADAAGRVIRDALHATQRHELRPLSARLWLDLAHIEEDLRRPSEAIKCLQEARADEHAYGRTRRQALSLLTGEFGRGEQPVVQLRRALAEHDHGGGVPSQTALAETIAPAPVPAPSPAEVTMPFAQPEPVKHERTGRHGAAAHAAPEAAYAPVAQPAEAETPVESETPAEPETPDEPAASATPESDEAPAGKRRAADPDTGSRHRSEAAPSARSVLERLGVTIGAGGRRRAPEEAEQAHQPEPAEVVGPPESAHEPPAEPAHEAQAVAAPISEPPAFESPAMTEVAEAPAAEPVAEDEEPEAPMAEVRPIKEMDSLLAVFSNWTDGDDDEPVTPRPRIRRHERANAGGTGSVSSTGTNGRVINGDNPISGKHRGEA
ncbi:MAG: hypothetical protein GEU86_11845 [Actinophytocola sp.]|nr:hypothetical protein [Actinophytocola sp.]